MNSPIDIEGVYRDALSRHQTGDFQQAVHGYQRVLQHDPRHAPSIHMLGVVAYQTGQNDIALDLLRKASNALPDSPVVHNDLGLAYERCGRNVQAGRQFRKAIALDQQFADAHYNLGNLHQDDKRHRQAIECYSQAVALQPEHPNYHYNLALAHHLSGDIERAESHYLRAGELDKTSVEPLVNLSSIYLESDRHEEAVHVLNGVLARDPARIEALRNLATLYAKQGDTSTAASLLTRLALAYEGFGQVAHSVKAYDEAISFEPDNAVLYYNRGVIALKIGQKDIAKKDFTKALELRGDFPEALINRALLASDAGDLKGAEDWLSRAITAQPENALAHNNLGNVLGRQGLHGAAIDAYNRAVELAPGYADAHANLGDEHFLLGRYDLAQASFKRAVELEPANAKAQVQLSTLLLGKGEFAAGWRSYEWRVQRFHGMSYINAPTGGQGPLPRPSTYAGRSLAGKHLMLVNDQGIGDELLFLRFAGEAKARGARLSYLAIERSLPLISQCDALEKILTEPTADESIDHTLLVGELPLLLGELASDVPSPVKLIVSEERRDAMASRLQDALRPPYIGVTWQAGTDRAGNAFKRVDPRALGEALRRWPGSAVILQRQSTPADVEAFCDGLGRDAVNFSESTKDLQELTALLSLLDDYVGVSNTNMHILAGLGRHARVLVEHPAHWRWMLEGDVSPWFPGFVLYRELPGTGWKTALSQLSSNLQPDEC